MKRVLRDRIGQILNGRIPEGYKKGKLGIVPTEWNEVLFSTLFTSKSVYTDDLSAYPLYSLTIEDGITPKTERYERSHLVKKENSYKVVRPNDYAYNPMNIRFGAVARHKGTKSVAVSGYYDVFTTVHENDLAFMDSFLTCGSMITYYNKVSLGSLIEKQRVHFSDFLKFSLPLPPSFERNRIARILTTQDQIITLKEKLIAEKQKQRKYLMQQLLTGKKRLPGFNGDWKRIKLQDILTFSNKHIQSTYETYVSTENMRSNYEGVFFEKGNFESVVGIKYYKNDVLVGNIRPYLKKIWRSDRVGVCSADVLVMQPRHVDSLYFYYLIANDSFFDYMSIGSKGSKMPRGDKKHIMDMGICIPLSPEEQKAIAAIFAMQDRELILLKKSLEFEKQKKKALMQLLLTGIVRV